MQLPVRVVDWHYVALCRRAQARGIGLGEVLRAILDAALRSEQTS